jgi:phospholipid-binding lipoprotein MlaA
VRDAAGRVPDYFLSPTYYIDTTWIWLSLDGLYLLDLDSRTLIPAYDLLQSQHPFDEYAIARNAYLQRRHFLIHGQSAQSQEEQELELQRSLEESGADDPGADGPGTDGTDTDQSSPPKQ